MSAKTKYLLLAGILIIAAFSRFYHITTTPPGLYMDEAMDGANAQNVLQTGQYKVFYPEDNGREGLYVNMLAVAFKYHILPDAAPWSVRFPAAVAGTLTVLGLYFLVTELFKKESRNQNPESSSDAHSHSPSSLLNSEFWILDSGPVIALLSAFLLATSFWHINFSRIGFRAILAPFCLVWAGYLLLKLFRTRSVLSAWLLALGSGIIYAAGFYTYIAFRITPLLLLALVPFFRKNPDFWKRAFLFFIVTFLVAFPIGWYYLKYPADFFGRTSQISVLSSPSPLVTTFTNAVKTALMFNWHGDYNWRHNLSGAPELWWPVGLLFLLGMIVAIRSMFGKKRGTRRTAQGAEEIKNLHWTVPRSSLLAPSFLFAWILLGSLPEILSNDGIPHALRSLLMVIPAVVFAAMGGVWLYKKICGRLDIRWQRAMLAFFFAATIGVTFMTYFKTWAENGNVPGSFNADYVAIGDAVNALPPDVQKYVVVYAGGVTDYGIPMPAMPVMYMTHSFIPDAVAQKFVNNIHYLLPSEINQIPAGTPSSSIFEIR